MTTEGIAFLTIGANDPLSGTASVSDAAETLNKGRAEPLPQWRPAMALATIRTTTTITNNQTGQCGVQTSSTPFFKRAAEVIFQN